MKSEKLPQFLAAVSSCLLGLCSVPSLFAQNSYYPEGNLTVTVRELEDGNVQFSLSGTATFQSYPAGSEEVQQYNPVLIGTNTSVSHSAPPATVLGMQLPLPAGLTLTIDYGNDISEPEDSAPQGIPLSANQETFPLDEVVLEKGNWYLGSFEANAPGPGGTISGAGTVTTSNVPFSYFVPGTYRVGPSQLESQGAEASEPEDFFPGRDQYFITYQIIPFTPAPAIQISPPRRFPKTRVRHSARSQEVTVSNTGNTKLTLLSLAITGGAARDFSHSPLRVAALDPGRTTKVSVGFRPHRKGIRRALLTVQGTAMVRQAAYSSEGAPPLENNIEVPQPSITVSDTAALEGKGIARKKPRFKRVPKPNSPRFPRLSGLFLD